MQNSGPQRLTDIAIPSTPAAVAAREVAERFCSEALVNHSVRSYLWAVAYARQSGFDFDDELLYVSAVLHDLALVEPFDSHRIAFEHAGAALGWVFAAGAGWSPRRRERVGEIIVRHMWPSVDPVADLEGHLLEVSTGIDVAGGGSEKFDPQLRADVLAAYPRLGFAAEFLGCFQDQAARKPESAAARLVSNGLERRLAENPLEPDASSGSGFQTESEQSSEPDSASA